MCQVGHVYHIMCQVGVQNYLNQQRYLTFSSCGIKLPGLVFYFEDLIT